MFRQLPIDCLNDILEFLEEDKNTLYSCLLVNRLWCEISVRILWRNVLGHGLTTRNSFRMLLACLSDESKELLQMNGIVISTPTLKSPLFNYVSFCNALSISVINNAIEHFAFKRNLLIGRPKPSVVVLLKQEILKMLMKEIATLKKLSCSDFDYFGTSDYEAEAITFIRFPGAKECLKNLLASRRYIIIVRMIL